MSSDRPDADDGLGFAPADPQDGRNLGEWRSRYVGTQGWIYAEAAYLMVLLALALVCLFLVWHETIQGWLGVSHTDSGPFAKVCYVWLAGLLGGTTFAMKWLYHTVARGIWNHDRRLWRLFTPHLSAAFALAILAFLASDLIGFVDQNRLRQPVALFAIAFLAGYFSDNTVAALARFADEYIGEPLSRRSTLGRRDDEK